MSVFFSSIQGVPRDSPAPLLAPPLTRAVARRAELTSAQKASEYLAAEGGGGGREVAQLREQLEEAREEGAMAKVQVARALTLAGRSPRSSTEHAMGGGDAQRGARGVDMLTSLEASEGHVREGRELVSQLEARLDAQAERVQEQDARLLAYARAQDARDGEVRAREAALARQQEQHRAQLGEWRTLVARREAALQVATVEVGVGVGVGVGVAVAAVVRQARRGNAPRTPPAPPHPYPLPGPRQPACLAPCSPPSACAPPLPNTRSIGCAGASGGAAARRCRGGRPEGGGTAPLAAPQ